jgi:citrate lyase beta subunit
MWRGEKPIDWASGHVLLAIVERRGSCICGHRRGGCTLQALIFGAEDWRVTLVRFAQGRHGDLPCTQRCGDHAAAFGLQAIDMVFWINRNGWFAREVALKGTDGRSGKQIIHPRQCSG